MLPRLGLALLLTVLATGAASAKPFHHPAGETREYNQDWLAACPDSINENATDYYGTSCFASTGSAELNSARLPAYKLTLFLNRLTGQLDVAFTAAATDGTEVDETRPLLFKFGTDAQTFGFGADLETRYNTINQYYPKDPARRDGLIALLKDRNAVTLTVPVTGGINATKVVTLSLRGVAASLDFMKTYSGKVKDY